MKAIKITVITLFAIVAVLWGLAIGGCKEKKPVPVQEINIRQYSRSTSVASVDSSAMALERTIQLYMKYQYFMRTSKEYEIKYLRTENDKYRILGNRAIDSANYYAKIAMRLKSK